mmetsp:Transcript_35679/g.93317  ORF Transcript_35679/g.93317 Transcript_35679/m.93317 type:complete len:131 (+) Transcript_35679:73-465(+)
MVVCRASVPAGAEWFDSCDWVSCDCLWQSLDAPVPNSEIVGCMEQGMAENKVTRAHQQFTYGLMKSCEAQTRQLAQPCGACDKYSGKRPACDTTPKNDSSIELIRPDVEQKAAAPRLVSMVAFVAAFAAL